MKIINKYKLWRSQQEKIEDILVDNQLLKNIIDECNEEIDNLKKQIFLLKKGELK